MITLFEVILLFCASKYSPNMILAESLS